MKNPETGKRVSRLNAKAEWIIRQMPELRILCDELWSGANARQQATRQTIARGGNIGHVRRPQYLFSGLTRCGLCVAGFIMAGPNRLACFGARIKASARTT